MKLRIKVEMVNDEQRVKSTIVEVKPVDFVQESHSLLQAINSYTTA